MHDHRIAIANSDPAVLAVLHEQFCEAGYEVTTYITAGTTHAQIRATQPRLVVLDTGLFPSASSWDLLKLLQLDPRTQRIPVLVTTVDHRVVEEKAAVLHDVGYDVLELPAPMADVLANVTQLLAWRHPHEGRIRPS